jgi:hypothetical protein
MDLRIETEKGNNDKKDVGTKSWMVTTVVEETSRWLFEFDNACEQMAWDHKVAPHVLTRT